MRETKAKATSKIPSSPNFNQTTKEQEIESANGVPMAKTEELTMQVIRWKEQEVKEAVAWVRDVKGVKNQKVLEAYRAGFENGYMKLFATLNLHKKLAKEGV